MENLDEHQTYPFGTTLKVVNMTSRLVNNFIISVLILHLIGMAEHLYVQSRNAHFDIM